MGRRPWAGGRRLHQQRRHASPHPWVCSTHVTTVGAVPLATTTSNATVIARSARTSRVGTRPGPRSPC
jgi:hypothetical protein